MRILPLKLLLATLLILPSRIEAQTIAPLHYLDKSSREESYVPMLRSDSTLFQRASLHSTGLYESNTRYLFSFVSYNKSLQNYYEREYLWSGLRVQNETLAPYQNSYNSSSLGDIEPLTLNSTERHRLSLRLSGDRYLTGVKYGYFDNYNNGWYFGLDIEARLGNVLYIAGVGEYSLRGSVRVGRRLSRSRFEILTMLNCSSQTPREASTLEAYALRSNYYNPAWGFHNNEVRSSKQRKVLMPQLLTAYEYDLTPTTSLFGALSITYGTKERHSLGWFDATTPQPDHYRSMPSYFNDPEVAEAVREEWLSGNSHYTQIDWQELTTQNLMSNGEAIYVEQAEVNRLLNPELIIGGKSEIGSTFEINYGIRGDIKEQRCYKRLEDLLGAKYHTDLDYYLIDDDTYSNSLENNLRSPSRKVVEGERFGFDYSLIRRTIEARIGMSYYTSRLRASLRGNIARSQTLRRGYYEKELFSGSGSYGESRHVILSPFYLALNADYAISPRHIIGINAEFRGREPELSDIFLQPDYNNRLIESPQLEKIVNLSLNFRRGGNRFDLELSAIVDMRYDGVQSFSRYDDLSLLYCNQVVEQISTYAFGLNVAAQWRPTKHLDLRFSLGALSSGYLNDPLVTLYSDSDNQIVDYRSRSYMSHCRVSSLPHLTGSIEARYSGDGWGASIDAAYAGLRYISAEYSRRTLRTSQIASDSKESYSLLMNQERMRDGFRLGITLWKSLRIAESNLRIYCGVDNLLGDDSTPYSGYESSRLQKIRVGAKSIYRPQDSRYIFSMPRTYYISLTLYI